MLRVRIDSREVEVTPVSLARLVLDGKAGRHDLTKTPGGAAERPLEYAVEPPHCEALTTELLRRLRSMYAPESGAQDIEDLRTCVESLCQWRWHEAGTRARILWAAAWLNELTGRLDAAVAYYDVFLRARCRESHLRVLAYNNRGALRIRLGRREGVADLMRSAIVTEPMPTRVDRLTGLPEACFNLLNLINVALEATVLTEAVDEEVSEFLAQLPNDLRRLWLGAELVDGVGETGRLREASSGGLSPCDEAGDEPSERLLILRDPTYRSVNRLTLNLAAGAAGLTRGPARVSENHSEPTACQLFLWANGGDSDVRQMGQRNGGGWSLRREHNRYAEAASLLLAGDIPSALIGQKSPGSRAEQLAQEELAEIENLVSAGNYELARSRLEVQRKVLVALNRRRQLAGLLEQVDTQLRWIAQSEKELEQLDFQRVCGRLVSEIEHFCQLDRLAQAERALRPLRRKLEHYKAQAPGDEAVMGLLDELTSRAERHMRKLRRSEAGARVRDPLRALRENWPSDWAVPVPESAYAALAECHINDPEGQIEDWAGLKDQLDAHQAQYCLRKALAELPADRLSWDEIEMVLGDALSLAPDLWLTVAPLFGLLVPVDDKRGSEGRDHIRTALESAAGRLLHEYPSALPDSGEDAQHSLLQRAQSLVARVCRQVQGDAGRFVRFWQCVEQTLSSAAATGTEQTIAESEAIAGTCLDYWPAGQPTTPMRADPRHPVRVFLESCEKARCLVQAERLLGEQPSSANEARAHLDRALHLGLETADQLRRAATAMYLIMYGPEDSARVQRQVLVRLDEWAEGATAGAEQCVDEAGILDALAAIRRDVLGAQPASGESHHLAEG